MKSLAEKVVLITGSSQGIGRETAYLFAKAKAKIVITYCQNEKKAETTVKKCKQLGSPEVFAVRLDVTDSKTMEAAIAEVAKRFGKIEILINNAGVIAWGKLPEQSFAEIDQQINTNLAGLIKMTKLSLPFLQETIINISSRSGQRGYPDLTTYCATKFGVRGFTKALACETKLKVFSVNPPLTKTQMSDYQGMPAELVAEVILDTAKRSQELESGADIAVAKPEEK
ncbi:MAG: SDR family oxidoreductase [Candidatus Omnitrophica bacterium]|nr:SDR family oxidoreductase [Candidatus Omnitrophota bacterium]